MIKSGIGLWKTFFLALGVKMAGMKVILCVFLLWGFIFSISECLRVERQLCTLQKEKSGKVYDWSNFGYWHECWNISVSTNEFIRLQMTRLETDLTCEEYNVTISIEGTGAVYQFCKSQFNKDPVIAFNNVTIDLLTAYGTKNMQYFTIEYIIKTRECLNRNSFECDEYSCISEDKVCDGVKDCENEKDEERCDCDCGSHGICSIIEDHKKCDCEEGFVEKDGTCKECNCGTKGACRFQNDEKICDCHPGFLEKEGKCTECDCGSHGSCMFEKDQKKCVCQQGFDEKYGTCTECDCGSHGSCRFEKNQKECHCQQGFFEKYGTCIECDCGPHGSCRYENFQKKCDCRQGFVERDGKCTDICSEDTCANGKCEVKTNGFICRCYEGFTGNRCIEKIKTISDKQDLWRILQVSMIFAIFILLSVLLCTMTLILKKYQKNNKCTL